MSEGAKVIRMGGQVIARGNEALGSAMTAGMAEGLSRAEMRERIGGMEMEIRGLRGAVAEISAENDALRRELREATRAARMAERRISELRGWRKSAYERMLKGDRRRVIDQLILNGAVAVTCLGAVGLILMAIVVLIGH